MSDSLLNSLVRNDTRNAKTQQEQTELLQVIADTQLKMFNLEQSKIRVENREKRNAKRKGADRNIINQVTGTKKETKEKKKSLLEQLLGGIGGALGGVIAAIGGAKLLGLLGLGALGTTITAYFTSPEFKNFVDKQIVALVDVMIRGFETAATALLPAITGGNFGYKSNSAPTTKNVPLTRQEVLDAMSFTEQVREQRGDDFNDEQLAAMSGAYQNMEEISRRMLSISNMEHQASQFENQIATLSKDIADLSLKNPNKS